MSELLDSLICKVCGELLDITKIHNNNAILCVCGVPTKLEQLKHGCIITKPKENALTADEIEMEIGKLLLLNVEKNCKCGAQWLGKITAGPNVYACYNCKKIYTEALDIGA